MAHHLPPSESKTSERRLEAVERQRKALELRKAGVSFERIATELGYASSAGSYQAVMAALDKTLREPADKVRSLELERLDAVSIRMYQQAREGNLGAIDRLMRLMERRARLLGLDMATQLEVGGLGGGPIKVQEVFIDAGPGDEAE